MAACFHHPRSVIRIFGSQSRWRKPPRVVDNFKCPQECCILRTPHPYSRIHNAYYPLLYIILGDNVICSRWWTTTTRTTMMKNNSSCSGVCLTFSSRARLNLFPANRIQVFFLLQYIIQSSRRRCAPTKPQQRQHCRREAMNCENIRELRRRAPFLRLHTCFMLPPGNTGKRMEGRWVVL